MRRLNHDGIRLVVIGVVAAIAAGGESAKADFTFGGPTNLGPTINSSSGEAPLCISADGLEMYIGSGRPGGQGDWDIWVTKRATTEEA